MEENLISKLRDIKEPVLSFAVYFYDALQKEVERTNRQSIGRTKLIPHVRNKFIQERGEEAYRETYPDILKYFDKAFHILTEKRLVIEQDTSSGKKYSLNPNI